MTESAILVERSAGMATVVLNRPERRNAVDGPLVAAFAEVLETLVGDPDAGAILIRGAGGTFCSGLDLKAMQADPRPAWADGFSEAWLNLHVALHACPKPLICALEGYAINAGSALALACDFVIAGEGAYLHIGEVEQGVLGPLNIGWLRMRHSEAVAARLAIVGKRTYGPELAAIGVALECVPDDAVVMTAEALAVRLGSFPNRAAEVSKRAIRAAGGERDARAIFEAARAQALTRTTPIPFLQRS